MANYKKTFNLNSGIQVDYDNFTVNANGLVGIGTIIPTEVLDVIGNARITGLVTTTSFFSKTAVSGIITAQSFFSGNFTGGIASVSQLNVSGISTLGTVKISSGIVTATSGVVTYYGDGCKLTNVQTSSLVGVITYSTSAGIATYASSSGIATYTTSAGIATYALSSGVSTSVIGGIASVSQLNVSGISTLGITGISSVSISGLVGDLSVKINTAALPGQSFIDAITAANTTTDGEMTAIVLARISGAFVAKRIKVGNAGTGPGGVGRALYVDN